MKIVIYDKNTKKGEFNTYGYGKLRLVQRCEVTDELNGRYDSELIVNREDSKAKYLKKWAIISDDGQLFRIVTKFDNDKDNTVKVFCKSIFYDIQYGFTEDSRAEGKTVEEAMQIGLPEDFKKDFEVSSDIAVANTLYFVKEYGADNMFSIIDRWEQGEIVRDNFKISINKSKGRDNGVTFTYKKIDAIEITEETDQVVTRLYPTGKDGVHLQEKYIYIPNWNEEEHLPFHITREIKFEEAENEGDLRILAQKEAEKIGLSRVNFTIKVNDLANTSLYRHMPNLMKVETGDIVTIKHSKLSVRVKVKCIKRVHEKVSDNLTLEFGQPSSNFFDSIDNSKIDMVIPDTSKLKNELFYYFNGSDINLKQTDSQLASIRIATSVKTNLMCHVTINPLIQVPGLLKLRITINDEDIQYAPIVNTIEGYNLLSFSIPFIAVEGGQTQVVKMWGEFEGVGIIPMNSLHFSITGQNVAMGLIKIEPFTGARITHKFDFSDVDNIDTIGKLKVNELKYEKVINDVSIEVTDRIDDLITEEDALEVKLFESSTKLSVRTEEVVEERLLLKDGIHEEDSVNMWWTGSWTSETHINYSEGKGKYSGAVGSSITFVTRGTGFKLFAPTNSSRGGFDIYVDRVKVDTVQQYSKEEIIDNNYFTHIFESDGVHEVKLIVIEKLDISNAQTTIIDKIEVLN